VTPARQILVPPLISRLADPTRAGSRGALGALTLCQRLFRMTHFPPAPPSRDTPVQAIVCTATGLQLSGERCRYPRNRG